MNLVLLGGNHIGNKKWIESMELLLRPYFDATHIQYYKHWTTGNEWLDLDYELQQLTKLVKDLDNYTIFARSAGAILTLKGNFEGTVHPSECIFVGIAIKWARHYRLPVDEWLKKYTIPSLIIQKTHDPAMPYGDLQQFLVDHHIKNVQAIEIPGDDHWYANTQEIRDFVKKYSFDTVERY